MTAISVYIVEDYKLTRNTYKHYFEQIEKEIKVIGDFDTAEECLDNMKKKRADVVLMDIGLPYMNGIEAAGHIKKKFPKTKIIMLTSHERSEEVLAALASGAHAYAVKDTNLSTLTNAIKQVNQGIVWLDSRISSITYDYLPKPQSNDLTNLYPVQKPKPKLKVGLTEQERNVLEGLKAAKTNKEIADTLNISPHTSKSHVSKVLKKLKVKDRTEAALLATKYDII